MAGSNLIECILLPSLLHYPNFSYNQHYLQNNSYNIPQTSTYFVIIYNRTMEEVENNAFNGEGWKERILVHVTLTIFLSLRQSSNASDPP
jgi:hypothetical protein